MKTLKFAGRYVLRHWWQYLLGIAALYVADQRFRQYYDRRIPGCAQWLSDAVQHWI